MDTLGKSNLETTKKSILYYQKLFDITVEDLNTNFYDPNWSVTSKEFKDWFWGVVKGIDLSSENATKELKELTDSFINLERATENYNKLLLQEAESDLGFYRSVRDQILDALTGNLSPLNSLEIQEALDKYQQENTTSLDILRLQLEQEKKTSKTRQEYEEAFNEYVQQLKNQKPEKTTDDVVLELAKVKQEIEKTRSEIESLKYR
jgi:hypothetical protein